MLLAGCAGGLSMPGEVPSAQSGADQQLVPPVLPAPLELSAGGKLASEVVLMLRGDQFSAELPWAAASANAGAGTVEFTPDFDPADGHSELAYCVFALNAAGYAGPAQVHFQWSVRPLAMTGGSGATDFWVGVADFSHGAWRWFDGPGRDTDTLALAGWDDLRGPLGEVYVVTAVGGRAACALGRVSCDEYDEIEPNEDEADWQVLPALSFSGFRGNVGAGGPHDGSQIDIYTLGEESGLEPGGFFAFWIFYDGEAAELTLMIGDQTPTYLPVTQGTGWIGCYPGPDFEANPPYTIYVTAVSGQTDYTLRAYDSRGPSAALTVDPLAGPSPLTVTLDAGASTDDEGVVLYRWDFEGDGEYDAETETATIDHIYTAGGQYEFFTPTVRVSDRNGLASTASTKIVVGDFPYDEIEDNDSRTEANPLPALPVIDFQGSFGRSSGVYDGYDGDREDYFSLDLAEGDKLNVVLDYDPTSIIMHLKLHDAAGNEVAEGDDWEFDARRFCTPAVMHYTVPEYGDGTYYILFPWGGDQQSYSDYALSVILGEAPVADFTATPDSGDPPLTVDFDAGSSSDADGSIVKYEWDFDTDYVFDEDTGASPTVQHGFATEGYYTVILRVTDDSGLSDMECRMIAVGDIYDEVEDNDFTYEANVLPALPFSGWRGSVGFPGYDGDHQDIVILNIDPGTIVHFTVTSDPEPLEWFSFYDDGGGNITYWDRPETTVVEYTTGPDEVPPIMLAVEGEGVDYTISAEEVVP